MEQEDFNKKMEKLKTPDITSQETQKYLKLTLLNARKSINIGIVLILLPFVFVFANIAKYNMGIDLGFVSRFVEWIMAFDKTPGINWILRFMLLGGPALAIIINLLSITHFYNDRESNEFVVTFRLKWLNISLILFCGFILSIFMMYALAEAMVHSS